VQAIIYHAKSAGLANRLRALVGYLTASYYLDIPFYLCWTADINCSAKFSSLFEVNFDLISEKKTRNQFANRATVFTKNSTPHKIWYENLSALVDWEDFYNKAHQLATQFLVPCLRARKIISEFADFDLTHSVGVHIRYTDNLYSLPQVASFDCANQSQPEGFEHFIKTYLLQNPSTLFFLSTDSESIDQYMKSLFKKNLIVYNKAYRDWQKTGFLPRKLKFQKVFARRPSTILDALIEMFLLSKCPVICGTYFSSFSKFAAFLGRSEYYEVQGASYKHHLGYKQKG